MQVIDNSRKWWKARNMHGQAAHVPHTIVTLLFHDDDVFSSPSANDWGRKGKKGDLRYFWARNGSVSSHKPLKEKHKKRNEKN